MRNEKMGQLLPFAQSAQALRRFAGKHRAQGNDLQAVELLRLSLQKDANDAETALSLAEAYAAIQCYALSNKILFPLIDDDTVGEACLFGIGCNMMSMGLELCARDCFVMYLQKYPDGASVQEAVEMLESCDEAEEPLSPRQQRVEQRVDRALRALDAERPALAVRFLRRALTLCGRDSGIYALFSFALLALPDPKQALEAAKHAVSIDREDLRARCALAIALYKNGAKNNGVAFLEQAAAAVQDEREAILVCHVACEMDAPQVVLDVLADTLAGAPYSDDVLHLAACAQYNNGNLEEAIRCWKLLRRIDPLDTVAEYRLEAAQQGTLPTKLPYVRQTPLEETLARLSRLRKLVLEGPQAMQEQLENKEGELEKLLSWALTSDEAGVCATAVSVLMTLSGRRAEALLLSVLCDVDASWTLKHEALAALCVMGVKGPFYVVIDGRMTLVRVSRGQERPSLAHENMLYSVMKQRTGASGEKEKKALRALCRAVLENGAIVGGATRMRTVAAAYALLRQESVDLPKKTKDRRKLLRVARRLAAEVENRGMREF